MVHRRLTALAAAVTLGAIAPVAARAEPHLLNLTDAPVRVALNCAPGPRIVHLAPRAEVALACAGTDGGRPVTLAARDPVKAKLTLHTLAPDALYLVDYDPNGAVDVRKANGGFGRGNATVAQAGD